ncbi:MAG: hypothetical protein OHK0013_32110 [Sandaracinaceae bacterium]
MARMGRSKINAKTTNHTGTTSPTKRPRSLVLVGMAGLDRNEVGKERPLFRAATSPIDGRLATDLVVVVDPTTHARRARSSSDEAQARPTAGQIAQTLVRDLRVERPERFRVAIASVEPARTAAGVYDPVDVRQRFDPKERETPIELFRQFEGRRDSVEIGICIDSGTPAQRGTLAAMAEERGFCASLVSVRGTQVRTFSPSSAIGNPPTRPDGVPSGHSPGRASRCVWS